MNDSKVFSVIIASESLVTSAIEWLKRNGANPAAIIANALSDLRRRGRSLPHKTRILYAERVLLGQFFARWAAKHRGRALKRLFDDESLQVKELRPFELALIAVGDEKAFDKLTPRFARKKMVEKLGLSLGTADGFTSYVAHNTRHLATLFLKNFDTTRKGAARNAVRYLQMTAVNWYLLHRTLPIRTDAPNLEAYLDRARLNPRSVLAVKLAYLPALLTSEERSTIRDEYGFAGGLGPRMPVRAIAKLLRYKNAAALSRKLYRIREWCRSSMAVSEKDEVDHEY